MTPTERKRLERDRRKAGLVRLELWVPADKLIAAMAAVDAVVEGSPHLLATTAPTTKRRT